MKALLRLPVFFLFLLMFTFFFSFFCLSPFFLPLRIHTLSFSSVGSFFFSDLRKRQP